VKNPSAQNEATRNDGGNTRSIAIQSQARQSPPSRIKHQPSGHSNSPLKMINRKKKYPDNRNGRGEGRLQFGRADCKCKSVWIAWHSIEHGLSPNWPEMYGTEGPLRHDPAKPASQRRMVSLRHLWLTIGSKGRTGQCCFDFRDAFASAIVKHGRAVLDGVGLRGRARATNRSSR
jgi:hypothetical protein